MSNKQKQKQFNQAKNIQSKAPSNTEKPANTLKDMLGADALAKLKLVETEMKADQERAAKEAAERVRREQEEKERNKSFADLLQEYDQKSGGKYR